MITLGARNSRRLILAVDLRSYSKHTSAGQEDAQVRLQRVMVYALRRARVARVRVQRQQQGDGQLVIFPPAVDESTVVPSLILGLRDGLYHLNLAPGAFGRMQMRAALGQGPVSRSANGYVGDSVVRVSRLLDAEALRSALEQSAGCDLALALAPELYRDVICQEPPGLPAAQFEHRQIVVPSKQFTAEAWLHLPRSSPAADLRAAAGVRWGDSPTQTALSTFIVPAVIAVHAAETARHLLAPSPPLVEWELSYTGTQSNAGQHRPPDHEHVDAHFDIGLERVESADRQDASHTGDHGAARDHGHDHDHAQGLDHHLDAAHEQPSHGDHYGHEEHNDHGGHHHHDHDTDDVHAEHATSHDRYGSHHHGGHADHHGAYEHGPHHDNPDRHGAASDHPIDLHHPGSLADALRHFFHHHSGPDHHVDSPDAAGPSADAGH